MDCPFPELLSSQATSQNRCRRCGAERAPGAPEQVCTRCALEAALASPAAADDTSAFLQNVPRPTRGPGLSEPKPPGLDTGQVGALIGHYRLLEKIGEGGYGVVYLAEQEKPVRRQVALKVIKLGMDTRQVIARFEAERQLLALMDHPHIAKVLEAGATEAGRPFFVMELVKGLPITRFCNNERLTVPERLRLLIQVCQAVQHAHQKGVIHRDLKPSNILVSRYDAEIQPRIIDFGIAKAAAEASGRNRAVFTAFEQFIGTPAYMSPEQAARRGLDIDTRSDIYSLGVLLYELLTGHTPFGARRLAEVELSELQRIVREEEPERPSSRLLALEAARRDRAATQRRAEFPALVRMVRGDLDWIVLKSLEKEPNRRYETAHGLAMDLQRFLANEPVRARPPTPIYQFKKMVCRHRVAFAAAATVALSLVVGIGVSTWQFFEKSQAEREQHRLRQQAEAAAADAAQTLAWSDFLQANRLLGEGKRKDALAFLGRSLAEVRTNPEPAIRAVNLLSSRSWWVPVLTLPCPASAQFSPDGKWLLTGYEDGTIQVRDAKTGAILGEPMRQPCPIRMVEFSSDQQLILATGEDMNARVWDVKSRRRLCVTTGHTGQILRAHFNGAGTRVVTSSNDHSVRVWNARTGQPVTSFLTLDAPVREVEFSPDGTLVAACALGHEAKIWEAESGRQVGPTLEHSGRAWAIDFSPDSKKVVTAAEDGNMQVWEVGTSRILLQVHIGGRVRLARFSPDGKVLLSASEAHPDRVWDAAAEPEINMARLWDAQTGKPVSPPWTHDDRLWDASFSPDGKSVVTVSYDHSVRIWDTASGRPVSESLEHPTDIYWAYFSPDSAHLVSASADKLLYVWAPVGKPRLPMVLPHLDRVITAQFNPEGTRIATASFDRTARIWNAATGAPIGAPLRHSDMVWSAQFSPDGTRIATASFDHTARIWDAATDAPLTPPLEHDDKVMFVQFSPDGQRLVTVSGDPLVPLHHSADGHIRVWDAGTGKPLTPSWQHTPISNGPAYGPVRISRVYVANFSPDGKRLVTAGDDSTARVWDASTGRPLLPPLLHENTVYWAEFSPDGRKIVTGSWDHRARIWDAETGRLITDLADSNTSINNVHFSRDGRRVLTSGDKMVRVWDAASARPLTRWLRHDDAVASAQFSPDGEEIVTACADGTAWVWGANSGELVSDPLRHGGPLHSAQFSPDGRRVITASADHDARVWSVLPVEGKPPDWFLELLEVMAGQKLDRQNVFEPTRLDRPRALEKIREELKNAPADDAWAVWGRGFLGSGSADRPAAPSGD